MYINIFYSGIGLRLKQDSKHICIWNNHIFAIIQCIGNALRKAIGTLSRDW
jgi:hypothetical protein